MKNHEDIRIGTLAGKGQPTPDCLRQILPHGFEEGWHNLETTGQVHALNCLKACRGGAFIPNPVSSTGDLPCPNRII